jgi:hypothetical protein
MSDSASERVVHHTEIGKREIDGGKETTSQEAIKIMSRIRLHIFKIHHVMIRREEKWKDTSSHSTTDTASGLQVPKLRAFATVSVAHRDEWHRDRGREIIARGMKWAVSKGHVIPESIGRPGRHAGRWLQQH